MIKKIETEGKMVFPAEEPQKEAEFESLQGAGDIRQKLLSVTAPPPAIRQWNTRTRGITKIPVFSSIRRIPDKRYDQA